MLHLNTIEANTYETLRSLFSKEYLKNFALVGGTNLSLRFGHRKSIDIDLFTTGSFSPEKLNDLLQIDFDYKFRSNSKYMLFGYTNNIKTDFIYHPFILLEPIEIIDGLRLFSLADVSAMKLFAVTRRGAKKDFFDIYKLAQYLGTEQLIHNFSKKYGEESVWMMKMSLVYFEDADRDEDPEILEQDLSWEFVKAFMKEKFSPEKLK